MGTTSSKAQSQCRYIDGEYLVRVNKQIEDELANEELERFTTIKILLLGAGECGKSTILKQMKILHASGFTEADYINYRSVVKDNLFESIVHLCIAMDDLGVSYESSDCQAQSVLLLEMYRDETCYSEERTEDFGQLIQCLWKDSGIRRVLRRSTEFQILDNAIYFLENAARICSLSYRPTVNDILMARARTTGITEVPFKIKERKFRVFDVSGQRSDRRKWIHCFDDVISIIFIVAVNEFDQKMREDNTTVYGRLHALRFICAPGMFNPPARVYFLQKLS